MKLSIVIPIYNTRDYLAGCVESVLDPACGDYEIILVNDGSTDDSGDIAAEYAARHPGLIRLITTENGGLGAARNVGLSEARGDYLLFLDSDDALEKGALREMLAMLDGSFDIAVFDLLQVNPAGEAVGVLPGRDREGDCTLTDYPELLFLPPSACNKLIRRSLFADSGVRFPGRVWFEDLRTTPKLYPGSAIRCVPRAWYRYLIRPGSITNSANPARNLEILDAVDDLTGYYRERGLYERYRAELEYLTFYNLFLTCSVRVCVGGPDREVLLRLRDALFSRVPDFRRNRYVRSMPLKHRLLTALLLRGQYRAVKALMTLNDRRKNKNGTT